MGGYSGDYTGFRVEALNSLNGRVIQGTTTEDIKGDTVSLDYGS